MQNGREMFNEFIELHWKMCRTEMLQRLPLGWSQKSVQKCFWDLVFLPVLLYAAAFSESFDFTKHKLQYTRILYPSNLYFLS